MKVFLCDFGMTKITLNSSSATATMGQLGTMRWRAPETFGKNPMWSTKADIYSLAVTMWELVARKIPFAEHNNEDIPMIVKMEEERPDIPEKCNAIVKKMIEWCWKQDPNERPSASELLQFIKENDQHFAKKVATPSSPVPAKQKEAQPRMNSYFVTFRFILRIE